MASSKKKIHRRWDEGGRKFSVILTQDCEHGKAGTSMTIPLEPEDGGEAQEAPLEDAFRSLMFHIDVYWPEEVPSSGPWPYELCPEPTRAELESLRHEMETYYGGSEEFGPDFMLWFDEIMQKVT